MELPAVTSLLLLLLATTWAQTYDDGDGYEDYVGYEDYDEAGIPSGSDELSEELPTDNNEYDTDYLTDPGFPTDPEPSVHPDSGSKPRGGGQMGQQRRKRVTKDRKGAKNYIDAEDYDPEDYDPEYYDGSTIDGDYPNSMLDPAPQNINLDELNQAVSSLKGLMETLEENSAANTAAQNEKNMAMSAELQKLSGVVNKLESTWAEMAAKGQRLNALLGNMEAKFEHTVAKLEKMETKVGRIYKESIMNYFRLLLQRKNLKPGRLQQ